MAVSRPCSGCQDFNDDFFVAGLTVGKSGPALLSAPWAADLELESPA